MPPGHQQAGTLLQLKVTLRDIDPPIWRRLLVPCSVTLFRLHRLLQIAMGWEDYHLYAFNIAGVEYGEPVPDWPTDNKSARRFRLEQVVFVQGQRFAYQYDFGDNWEHDILVEHILARAPGTRYPVCIDGSRACPPEDCGGPWGYAELLEIIQDPSHEEYLDRLEWLGEGLDPEAFNLDLVNQRLARMR